MNEIDNAINQIYSGSKTYSELGALERLTDRKVLDAIKFDLEQRLVNKKYNRQKIFVDFEWIDKIPVADFCQTENDKNGNPIEEKVEVGDLFIRYNRKEVSPIRGEVITRHWENAEIVVQAKKTDEESFFVPITSMSTSKANSTSKELKLLEDWPTFDLYKTARNKLPEKTALSIKKGTNQFAFYGGFSNKNKTWKFGNAKYKEECKLSFSELIKGLVDGTYGKNKLDKKNPDSSWNEMSDYIETLCEEQFAPPKLFGENESRRRTTSTELYCCKPLFKLFEFLQRHFRKNKFLIISINRVDYEGFDE